MSLRTFVNKNPLVRDALNGAFPNQGQRVSSDINAPAQTTNYMLVGATFDYLARFWLTRHLGRDDPPGWVAHTGLRMTEQYFPDHFDRADAAVTRAENQYTEYLESGALTDNLIEATMDLTRVENVYRDGTPDSLAHLGEYEQGDITDCRQLYELLDDSSVLATDDALLNPTFGMASTLINADADVILNKTLVDLKVTKSPTFKASYWRQLVGYCLLADICNTLYDNWGVGEIRLPDIEEFGVYFARHGELKTVTADTVYDADEYEEFRGWFVEQALSENEQVSPEMESMFREEFCDPYTYSAQ